VVTVRNITALTLAFLALSSTVYAVDSVEFDAALGKTGYGRCHMDSCEFFLIDQVVPLGKGRDGTLFAYASRDWDADYKPATDDHEYDRPPVRVNPQKARLNVIYCSKARPTMFDYFEDKWHAAGLRPGDETAVFGFNESAYQFYFAACHHFITKDPISKTMAQKLGYTFAKRASDGDNVSDGGRQPMDMLK
jgi:hypothetical protein